MNESIAHESGAAQAPAPAAALLAAVEALLGVALTGVRRDSDRESYRHALHGLQRAAADIGLPVWADTAQQVADNLATLQQQPHCVSAALLPLLDYPIALLACIQNPGARAGCDALLACLADPNWPRPLDAQRSERMRARIAAAGERG
jgi:hypothetical protein